MIDLREECKRLGISDRLADELAVVARNDTAVFAALSHAGLEELPTRLAVVVVALSQLNAQRLNERLEQMRGRSGPIGIARSPADPE